MLDGLRWAYPYRLGQAGSSPGDTVTIAVAGPVARTWFLVAGEAGEAGEAGGAGQAAGPARLRWGFRSGPGPRRVAGLSLSTEQAWRLLTGNLPAGERSRLAVTGDPAVVDVLVRTRAVAGVPH